MHIITPSFQELYRACCVLHACLVAGCSTACMCRLAHGEMMVRGKCLFGGLIIQCFFNGLLLIGLGTHDEYAEESEQDYHVSNVSWLLP